MKFYTFPIKVTAEGESIDEAWENILDLYGIHGVGTPDRPDDKDVEIFDPEEDEG